MLNWLLRSRQLGLADTRGRLRRRILLSNQLALFSIAATVPYQWLYLSMSWPRYEPIFLSNCAIMFGYVWTLWANSRHRYASARSLVLSLAMIQLFCGSWYLGPNSGIHLFYFALVALLPLLFDEASAGRVALIALVNVCLFLLCQTDFEFINGTLIGVPGDIAHIVFVFSAISSIALTCIFVLLFRIDIHTVEAKLVEANAELSRLSLTDPLTGLLNRRGIDEWLRTHVHDAAASGGGRGLGVVALDIDDFKAFNDYYGHPVGDDVLQRVADRLVAEIRTNRDIAARHGGEEFLLLLSDATLDETATFANRLCAAVRALEVEHVEARNEDRYLTVSVGYDAGVVEGRPDLSALTASADEALYRAKAMGRDRAAGPSWTACRIDRTASVSR